ncbi:hypothetical protein BD560DRAFT_325218 [Blakeslea trispora]|nr:hypothetical protein BD560DRAFT_325218 [Blakeslea trispora]
MRHPDILRYLDGVETEQSIMFVTEPVEPLSSQLNQDPDNNLILWGLYKIANAIKFLNHDCDMVHGNVRVPSVFTNKAGEWKLGGFELLCSMKEESPIILTFGGLVPDAQRYASPEVKKSGWTAIKELPSGALDAYHLGCLIYESYNHRFDSTDQLLSQKGSIPLPMQRIYATLLHPSARSRASADRFLDEGLQPKGFFSTDFVKVNLFLENISIKEPSEKEGFFRKLDSFIDTFPSEFAKYKILPELIKAFEFGSGGAKALSAIVKVGEHLTTEEYQAIVIAPIVRMFASPDRAIRVSLLDNMPKFINHMNNKMVTNQIFPSIATGFTDTIPIIREQTIKSVLLIVPKLNDRVINYDLLKYLAKLQMDPEPGIRTNTTICLGKIAKHLNDSTRKKVLVPAFTRSLRDGFHHARVAALMALNATSEFYDAQECACRIVPAISNTLIDKEKIVRDQAFKVMQCFIQRIQTFADKMPETAIVEQSSTPSENNVNQDSAGMAGILGGATKGLTDWAVSSIQSRFIVPTGEINNPVQTIETTTSIQTVNSQTHSQQVSMKSIEVDLKDNDTSAWDDEESTPFDFSQPTDDTDNGWDQSALSFTKPTISTNHSPLSAVSSFGLAPASKAPSSMKLTHKPKTVDIGLSESGSTAQTSTGSQISKEDKKAELERRREERRQRMAELREKKKTAFILLLSLIETSLCITLPTKTAYALQARTVMPIGTPTHAPLRKRDVEDDLELYQNWASMCRNRDNHKELMAASAVVSDLNDLWKTVTETVNCGGGTAVTVTTTVRATPTSKPSSSKPPSCHGQCWSDYLWHTYGDGISPAQGFVGTLSTMTWIGLVNNEPAGGYPLGDVIYICVSAGIGILGALILIFLYPLGVYCLACLGGFYLAKVARVCFIIGISLLGPILLFFVETYMVIFSTALIGAYLFYFGLDFFAHTGFINPWLLVFDGNPNHHNVYLMSKPVYIMLAFVIVNTLISVGWQYYWNIIRLKSPGFGLNPPVEEEKEKPPPPEKEPCPPPPPTYVCMPPPYCPQQPMIMQQVCAPQYHPH